jgi:hypothetical protein
MHKESILKLSGAGPRGDKWERTGGGWEGVVAGWELCGGVRERTG